MNEFGEKSYDAVSHCNDEFYRFTPYGKGESVYDQSRKWKLKISWIERNL